MVYRNYLESNFPEAYASTVTIRETEEVIKDIKDYFQGALAKVLNLSRVSATCL